MSLLPLIASMLWSKNILILCSRRNIIFLHSYFFVLPSKYFFFSISWGYFLGWGSLRGRGFEHSLQFLLTPQTLVWISGCIFCLNSFLNTSTLVSMKLQGRHRNILQDLEDKHFLYLAREYRFFAYPNI